MIKYVVKRLLHSIPLLFGITLISFFIVHLAPGRPTDMITQFNPKVSQDAREKLSKIYGFDKPVYVQYAVWLAKIARFDFGLSFSDNRPVIDKIAERMPVTLFINTAGLLIIFGIAVPLGVKSAVRRGSVFDRVTTVLVFILFSAPAFWVGLMLMSLLGLRLGWLPVAGLTSLDFDRFSAAGKAVDLARHLALPVFVTSMGGLAGISRYTRERMISVLHEDYVRTARAKGLSAKTVIYKHAFKNALLPVITILGLSIPALISGSVIIESVFNIPGMGRLMVEAVFARDYNLVMGELVIAAVLTLLGNLIADVAYSYADPRIRYQ